MTRRLRLPRPATETKKVVELVVSGPVGRGLRRRGWGAFTLPLPSVVVIFYWMQAPPLTRVHEAVHVEQDETHRLFWIRYLLESLRHLSARLLLRHPGRALMSAYRANRFEVEAYGREQRAKDDLPEWARA
jgi:hypothetical protein